ncbi:MAG TPA: glycosyltransferase, partial [Bacteroidia bacterium]|nr:glycosyltransferase [Bacteroidia bacterium]
NSKPLSRGYKTVRFKLWFTKGPLFYFFYNLRLFFYLYGYKPAALHANDLDTLLPNFLISKWFNIPLVYDSHEFFTGVPELQNRKWVRLIWEKIEEAIFPKLKFVSTVNASIANLYQSKYNVQVSVIRNVPMAVEYHNEDKIALRQKLSLPKHAFIAILQGNGINVHRGAEQAVAAMQFVDACLIIAGNGDVLPQLKQMVADLNLSDKVIFKPSMPFADLCKYTMAADLGLTLDLDTNLNYKLSLPNKLFDYIQCRIPILASNLVEVAKIIKTYDIGITINKVVPLDIAKAIHQIKGDDYIQEKWKMNLEQAALDLTWFNEKQVFCTLIEKAFGNPLSN